MLMSCGGNVEEKTSKSNPIYRNRLVNMLVNHTMKHEKRMIGLRKNMGIYIFRQTCYSKIRKHV